MEDRMFVHTKVFDSQWSLIGCGGSELHELQKAIGENPQLPPIVKWTGGGAENTRNNQGDG
jgi:hypothetical protein